MTNYTQPVVEPATFSILETYWAILWYPMSLLSRMYDQYGDNQLLLIVDTAIYCVMSCLLFVLTISDGVVRFVNKVHHKVQLIRTFLNYQMYKNIN